MEQALKLVSQLVRDFQEQERAYLSSTYQESQVRQDFIDKFFIALGWDVTHEKQKNPYEQEVKIENRVRTESSQRYADYAFFIAPNYRDVKYFVEAKKPAKDLSNPDYYHQIIRYGWNKSTPIAVLTDFEEFHIIDCRYKPNIKTALEHKIESFHYAQYGEEEVFKKIFYLFGREAVANGSIEKYADTLARPKGKKAEKGVLKSRYQQVDQAFLELLDGYRDQLAHAFKNKNRHLTGEELTEAVQRTIDRLVFIRFLEDKGIEENTIIGFKSKPFSWDSFLGLCKSLEPKYNGLVFKEHPIIDNSAFNAPDEKVFSEICSELADPSSPYDFNFIPISILGNIYERFLGKVVTTTDKRAKITEKPEVRKAGGVYYTPEYIVRYIVDETVGMLIEGKKPEEIRKMAFADIACGSGSFLIEVYDRLLKYHLMYYTEHPEKAKKGDIEKRAGAIALSHKKRQEILVNNIYGVDIDFQATEVTQLSLYLKLMEDVTMNDAYQFSLLKERMLPDLRHNIVCGNSLIGRDILDGTLFNYETEHTLKPMNFEDVFPEIMKRDGFDVVVGNPPWGATLTDTENSYLTNRYINKRGESESHLFFIEKAVTLLKRFGLLGYVTPNTWLSVLNSSEIRKYILDKTRIIEIVELSKYIFEEAPDIVPLIIIVSHSKENNTNCRVKRTTLIRVTSTNFDEAFKIFEVPQSLWETNIGSTINLRLSKNVVSIVDKCNCKAKPLLEICDVLYGIKTGDNTKFISNTPTKEHKYKALKTGELVRYCIEWKGFYLWWTPMLAGYRGTSLEVEKIIVQYIRKISMPRRIIAAMDSEGLYYPLNNYSYIILKNRSYSLKYVLGILNSSLINFYFANTYIDYNIKPTYLQQLPISMINFEHSAEKAHHDNVVTLVEQMLAVKSRQVKANTEAEKNRLEIQIEALDRQIDAAVYELYGLTEEEIKIVEGKNEKI